MILFCAFRNSLDTFFNYRRGTLQTKMVNAKPNVLDRRRYVQERLSTQIQRLQDVEIPTDNGNAVREELSFSNQKAVDRFYAVI